MTAIVKTTITFEGDPEPHIVQTIRVKLEDGQGLEQALDAYLLKHGWQSPPNVEWRLA